MPKCGRTRSSFLVAVARQSSPCREILGACQRRKKNVLVLLGSVGSLQNVPCGPRSESRSAQGQIYSRDLPRHEIIDRFKALPVVLGLRDERGGFFLYSWRRLIFTVQLLLRVLKSLQLLGGHSARQQFVRKLDGQELPVAKC